MSQIKIEANPSGGGIYTLQSGAGSTDRTITLPDKAGEVAVGAGTIVQVVQGTTNTAVTVSTTTYTDTGLTASITPTSSSNKILVMVSQFFNSVRGALDQGFGIKILRDSTTIFTPTENTTGPVAGYVDNSVNFIHYHSIQYLDSPATTSSTTYKTQGRPYITSSSGSITFNWDGGTVTGNPSSVITLMEVVA